MGGGEVATRSSAALRGGSLQCRRRHQLQCTESLAARAAAQFVGREQALVAARHLHQPRLQLGTPRAGCTTSIRRPSGRREQPLQRRVQSRNDASTLAATTRSNWCLSQYLRASALPLLRRRTPSHRQRRLRRRRRRAATALESNASSRSTRRRCSVAGRRRAPVEPRRERRGVGAVRLEADVVQPARAQPPRARHAEPARSAVPGRAHRRRSRR